MLRQSFPRCLGTRPLWLFAGGLSAALLVLTGCGTTAQTEQSVVSGGSDYYSITVVVENQSTTQTIALSAAPRVDNNAKVVSGYLSSIGPGDTGTYKAENTGNGVHMWLDFTSSAGPNTISLDNDVPKVNENTYSYTIDGPSLTMPISDGLGDGQTPTATVILKDCNDANTCSNGGTVSQQWSGR